MKKRFLSSVLSICMVLSLLPLSAAAADVQAEPQAQEETLDSIQAGDVFYFDLSGQDIPGTVNSGLPDETLHWVPFTYAGEIDAYVLNASSSGVTDSSVKAAENNGTDTTSMYGSKYQHQLFIADYNVTTCVQWYELNAKNLIFGTPYTSGNIEYTLRAPTMGSSFKLNSNASAITESTPASNEWSLMSESTEGNPAPEIIKNASNYSWGQDTMASNADQRVMRKNNIYGPGLADASDYWANWTATVKEQFSYRPVLEPHLDEGGALQAVEIDLNGGSIGEPADAAPEALTDAGAETQADNGAETIHIVVCPKPENHPSQEAGVEPADADEPETCYPAPSGEGLTGPSGKNFAGWKNGADDDSGKTYSAGDSVPSTVTKLTAVWAESAVSVTAPTFDAVTYGYTKPNAKAITITNAGNQPVKITGVMLTGANADSFTLTAPQDTNVTLTTTDSGKTNTDWEIQPNSGLDAGTYTAAIKVTWEDAPVETALIAEDGEDADLYTATGTVTFTVNPVEVSNVAVTLSTGVAVGDNLPDAATTTTGVTVSTEWIDSDNNAVTKAGSAGNYTAKITVTADDNYKLASNVNYTLNGKTVSADNNVLSTTVTVSEGTVEINSVAITLDIKDLKVGDELPEAETETAGVTLTTEWFTSNSQKITGTTFTEAGTYTAMITPAAKEGYTLSKTATYTVNSQSSTLLSDSLLVTVTVSGTETEITSVEVTLNTEDLKVGDTLPEAKTTTDGVILETTWYRNSQESGQGDQKIEGPTFTEAGTYTAMITPAAEEGYTLAQNAAYKVNGQSSSLISESLLVTNITVSSTKTEITSVSVTLDLSDLQVGNTLPTTVGSITTVPANAATATIEWFQGSSEPLTDLTIREAGSYGGTITVTPAEGYQLGTNTTYTQTIQGGQVPGTWSNGELNFVLEVKETKHTVTIDSVTNGQVTVKVGDEEVKEGGSYTHESEVTITVKPNDGCELDSLQVTIGNKEVELTKTADGAYTFKLTGDATITATFKEIPKVTKVAVTLNTNGLTTGATLPEATFTAEPNDSVTVATVWKNAAGEEVTTANAAGDYTAAITVTAKDGYMLDSSAVYTLNGETQESGTMSATAEVKTEISEVDVRLQTRELAVGDELPEATCTTEGVSVSTEWYLEGEKVTDTQAEGTYTAHITVTANPGYVLAQDVAYHLNNKVVDLKNGVLMETITVETNVPQQTVTFNNPDHGSLTVTVRNETLNTGDQREKDSEVEVTVTPNSGYELDSLTVTIGGQAVTPDEENGVYIFKLTGDAVIHVEFKETTKYNLTVNATPSAGGTATGDTTLAEGETATVTIKPSSGYELYAILKNGVVETTLPKRNQDDSYTYTFQMPAADVTVLVIFAKTIPVNANQEIAYVNIPDVKLGAGVNESDVKQPLANSEIDASQFERDNAAKQEIINLLNNDVSRVIIYFEMTAKTYNATEKRLTLDITPMYKIEKSGDDESDNSESKPLTAKITTPVEITVGLPDAFHDCQTVYVTHEIYVYTGTVQNGKVTFTNPHGFSEFTITAENPAAAQINSDYYATLQAAVNEVTNGGTITLLKDGETAIVDKVLSFTVNPNGHTCTITAGSGLTNSGSGNNYNYVIKTSGGGSSSSGSGSGSGGVVVTTYAVTIPSNVTGGKVTASAVRVSQGTTVTLTVTPDEGYQLDTLTVTDKNGREITMTDKGEGKYTFTMPAGAVSVAASFVETQPEKPGKPDTPDVPDKPDVPDTPDVPDKPDVPLPFTDVPESEWYYEAVRYVYHAGLMNGTETTIFDPNITTTRGMLATILYRLEGEPATGASVFTDVANGEWYSNAITWASANGIVNGYGGGLFGPEDPITREQMAAMLYRYAQFKGYDVSASGNLPSFPDAGTVSDWAADAMRWTTGVGLIIGSDGLLNPCGDATRAEMATILMRFCEQTAE